MLDRNGSDPAVTSPEGYIPRLVDGLITELFTTFPAVLLP